MSMLRLTAHATAIRLRGEEQRRAYRRPGHEGEGSTPQGREADAHLDTVIKIFRLAKRLNPFVVLSLENPDAGLTVNATMRQAADVLLNLKECHMNYCMHDDGAPMKPTVLFTNSESLIREYADGAFLCKHGAGFSHKETVSNLGRREAAAYPQAVAAFWANHVFRDARKRAMERERQAAPPAKRVRLT